MSSRVTRSAARQATATADPPSTSSSGASAPPNFDPPAPTTATRSLAPSRKRKVAATAGVLDQPPLPEPVSPPRLSKRQKTAVSEAPLQPPPSTRRRKAKGPAAMEQPGPSPDSTNETPPDSVPNPSRRRPSSRTKRLTQDPSPQSAPGPSRRTKKPTSDRDADLVMRQAGHKTEAFRENEVTTMGGLDREDGEMDRAAAMGTGDDRDDEDDDDPFAHLPGGDGPSMGISNTLRALSGMMSGVSSRLRDILAHLRQKEDPSVQLIALQELSELLLVSTEDNLSGHFSPDQFVKELVVLMQPSELGEENPEMMLLACRCIANLMEALPAATANVVYGGAVPVLCQKLLEIHYIDLAEQALSTLEKISAEFPASIVREGGLTACLTYLDFFATSTQRTAVTTAANCCRNIPADSFPVIRDVMPILLNVLSSSDQKVVEQGCLCVSRVVESFRYRPDTLEELVSTDLLRAITRLLLPGTTNLIGPSIHTQFLRVLAFTARASPKLSADLFRMNVVDTLYQILTGVSPPSGTNDVAAQIDSVIIMQALIHKPRDQVFETLNVICELLPSLPRPDDASAIEMLDVVDAHGDLGGAAASRADKRASNDDRIELLRSCEPELKRFATILLPTLTDAYSSTVNLSVRQKVLNAQLKMLSHLDVAILEEALRTVPYASYLASILSQQDHPTLVVAALQAAELLLERLPHIYRYQFHREGVIAEVAKLATPPLRPTEEIPRRVVPTMKPDDVVPSAVANSDRDEESEVEGEEPEPVDGEVEQDDSSDEDADEYHDETHDEMHDDLTASPVSSHDSSSSSARNHPLAPVATRIQHLVSLRAKKFLEAHEQGTEGQEMRDKAAYILQDLCHLSAEIEAYYLGDGRGDGINLFTRLAASFDGDALESITSAELLNAGIVEVLLRVFTTGHREAQAEARAHFLRVFMSDSPRTRTQLTTNNVKAPVTSFGAFVHKLQDLLSRSEHFEVITVHQNSFDGNRSSAASMLAKQIRLKLVADDDSEIPRPYRNIMVSIHAIATFKALDDYLRPRISLLERPRGARHREGMSHALAAFAAAAGLPNPHHRLSERGLPSGATTGSTPSTSPMSASRSARKAAKTKTLPTPAAGESSASIPSGKTTGTRRSSRRHQLPTAPPPLPPPPLATQETDATSEPHLECADEKQLADGEEMDDADALDAIVDDLDDELDTEDDDGSVDPTAVSLEVASTGKITARKEDGTRVATPSQALGSSTNTTLASNALGTPTPSSSTRHMSYAAAMQAVPQDWHIEFSIDGKSVSNETTIYRAVHHNQTHVEDALSRNVWSAVHPIRFQRVSGPPPPPPSALTPPPEMTPELAMSGLPLSLDKNPTTSTILRLLDILHALNANVDVVLDDPTALLKESASQFVNTKLTAKLNRQLEEPLIVASNCLPSWSEDLARLYPFLFPFETRHLFLQSTSFGYSRSMTRWQNAQSLTESRHGRHRDERPFLGRLQRQKVRISRTRILESAIKVMELYGASPSVLEVEYFDEVGTGLGPTLEFYSTVSKEFSKKKLKMWRENESNDADDFAFGRRGLFPAPMSAAQAVADNGRKVLHLFRMLGKFVARSMLDSRIIDVSFNPTFFRVGDALDTVVPSLMTIKSVDESLATSLKLLKHFAQAKRLIDDNSALGVADKSQAAAMITVQGVRVEDLGLDFTLPGYPSIELEPDGSNVPVTMENVGLYVDRVIDMTLGSGVQRQVDAFKAGFSSVFPYTALRAFTPDELVMLFGRVEEDWSLETLMDSIKADHGFNMDSKSVKNLLQAMSELTASERRDFLQFVTGSPKLPIGGFKNLTPMFTVVCKPSEPPHTSDDYLPSVMTCVNYLKLPDYTDLEIMRRRLNVAISEGQGAFHLS